jgi:hypothetical protein
MMCFTPCILLASANWALFGATAYNKWSWYGTLDFNYIGGSLLIKLKYSLSSLIGAVAMWGIFIPSLQVILFWVLVIGCSLSVHFVFCLFVWFSSSFGFQVQSHAFVT